MNKDHPEVKFGNTGVLIINLGTPDSTNWWDIRKYLKEFLSDRRVIEVNPIIWQIILNLFILTFRPSKTAHAYKQIWRKENNESPLLFFTKKQALHLNNKIGNEKYICFDKQGEKVSSECFANMIYNSNGNVNLIVGGAFGLADSVLESASKIISFSDMEFSHEVFRVMLLEQVYRANCIFNHHPYHQR